MALTFASPFRYGEDASGTTWRASSGNMVGT
jgi:hypothetical protein